MSATCAARPRPTASRDSCTPCGASDTSSRSEGMSGPATGEQPTGSTTWDERRWHYRRSLASRVVLLTTIAVGLAVAFVALGAFLTVRMSMQSSLDNSLLERAQRASGSTTMADIANEQLPLWAVGAADVRIF